MTEQTKAKRLERCKRLRKRFAAGRQRKFLFLDEKWFHVGRAHNRQNDRIWLKGKPPLEERMIPRRQKPKQVMVWAGIAYTGNTPLIFVHEGVKVQDPSIVRSWKTMFYLEPHRILEKRCGPTNRMAPHLISPKKLMNGLRETFRTSPRRT
ncbi:hypothetical protein ANCDUO_23881 [Ancylostoma duodenale]|uniref:Tc1-like transposase DDE domain-containing protein n=1 Tax=Ancylostoma duodenale TaxID=51022 RepID=A0A0C2BQJ6_9BILA|nr:hypothetical protein ANCDUO_23881 [Ancylostoma duodenale]